jgi:hypothetical protein
LATKVYRKPTHTGRYQHFKTNHPHHVKGEVVHSLNRAKVICQDQNDFDKEIKNLRYGLVFSEYPQEFVTSIMKKPSRSKLPSPETADQGKLIIPCVKGFSEKFKGIGTLMKLDLSQKSTRQSSVFTNFM